MHPYLKVTEMSHMILARFLKPGQRAVDATAGNGQDTLFLARAVGSGGKVYSFDIQEAALEKTRLLLKANGCLGNVELIHDSHENLDLYVQEPVDVLLYNLGYLPGGDKNITTTAQATGACLHKGIRLLADGGLIVMAVYTGHPGGREESNLVQDIFAGLPAPKWQVFSWRRENGSCEAPYLLVAYQEGAK